MFSQTRYVHAPRLPLAVMILFTFISCDANAIDLQGNCLLVKSGEHYVLQQDLTVECVEIEENGKMTVDPEVTLTHDGGDSTINGTLHVNGKLAGYGTISGGGVITNDGRVTANEPNQTFWLFGGLTLEDSASSIPRWCVYGTGSTMRLEVAASGLSADFGAAVGALRIDEPITTTGKLYVGTEASVDVNTDVCVSSWEFVHAPNQSGCGGTVDTVDGTLYYDDFKARAGCGDCQDPGLPVLGECRDRRFLGSSFTCED